MTTSIKSILNLFVELGQVVEIETLNGYRTSDYLFRLNSEQIPNEQTVYTVYGTNFFPRDVKRVVILPNVVYIYLNK